MHNLGYFCYFQVLRTLKHIILHLLIDLHLDIILRFHYPKRQTTQLFKLYSLLPRRDAGKDDPLHLGVTDLLDDPWLGFPKDTLRSFQEVLTLTVWILVCHHFQEHHSEGIHCAERVTLVLERLGGNPWDIWVE